MLGHRELTMEDYIDILRRRAWLILGAAVLLLAASIAVSYFIPPRYQSQTLILIEQQKVPEDYVKPVVEQDLGARLASMREQIVSRSRLEPIIQKFGLFSGHGANMDDRVALTQKAIGVKPIPAGQSGGMPGFFVSFTASNPHTAQQVCGEITSLFVTENLSAREASAKGTTDFLKQQLADSKKNLDDQDARLAAFQQKYFGSLPDQQQSNSNTLSALTTQLDAATQSVSRQQQNATFLQAMVSQQQHALQNSEPAAAAAVVDERRAELKALIQERQTLQAQYTPDHPDVIEINRKIKNLQSQIARSEGEPHASSPTAPASHADTPELQQLKAQLRAAQVALDDARREQASLSRQVGAYEGRIASSPQVEEQYKQITRDHETALDFYNSLLKKMNESSMATALEQRQQGEQFRVMDAPNLPEDPVFPNRLVFAAGGFASGLFLGIVIAGLLEYRDTSLRTERDIWAFTKLPALGSIAHVDDLPEVRLRSRWNPFARLSKPSESSIG